MEGVEKKRQQEMKDLEDKRQKEREEDKSERKANVDKIKEGVKNEMLDVIKPWQERTVRVEESTAQMGVRVEELMVQVRELREQLATKEERQQSYAAVARRRSVGGAGTGVLTGANAAPIGRNTSEVEVVQDVGEVDGVQEMEGQGEEREERQRVRSLLAYAKKVVGLKPISKIHVEYST